jgi:RNA polymerase primary sigma factor
MTRLSAGHDSNRDRVERKEKQPRKVCPTDSDLRRRIHQLLNEEIDFIPNREFFGCEAGRKIVGSKPAQTAGSSARKSNAPSYLPVHLSRMCETPLLSADEERDLFRRMNYLKFRANALRSRLNPARPNADAVAEIEQCLAAAREVRDRIIRANLRLLFSIVKKFVGPRHPFDELLSEGVAPLMRAVDNFDYAKGFRFSTYASRAIARDVHRSISHRRKQNLRFCTAPSHSLSNLTGEARASALEEREWMSIQEQIIRLMGKLDWRERVILRGRFGLSSRRKVRTLQCLADQLCISKERVRQLESRAIGKLKVIAEEAQVEYEGPLVCIG